ncbi:MAG: cohesin domain-containing protein [Gemmatimonadota bacterium]|nr:cohesin domain-containing protein [Gemmatimonadota bacterium]
MQAKRLLCCGFAFLMVLAFAGGASALDVSDAQGTWVRIESPANGAWAAIGDTVVVEVSTVSAATEIAVAVVAPDGDDDDTAPDALPGTAFTASNTELTVPDDDRAGGSTVALEQGAQDATVVTFYLPVDADAANDISRLGLFVQVTITGGGSAAGTILNTTTDEQILAGATGFATTKVGDGITFGIDNQRPIHDGVFTTVDLVGSDKMKIQGAVETTTALFNARATTPLVAPNSEIKKDDAVNVSLTLARGALIAAGASKATVFFVKESLILPPLGDPTGTPAERLVVAGDEAILDSAITSVVFTDLHAAQPLVKTVDTSEGVFGDGLRVRAFGFLQDEAGNLGAATAVNGPPAGAPGTYTFTTGDNGTPDDPNDDPTENRVNLFVIDTTSPKVTVAYPKAGAVDSTHLSAGTSQIKPVTYYSDSDGTLGPVPEFDDLLKHLTLEISENIDTLRVTLGDSAFVVARTDADVSDTAIFDLPLLDGDDPAWDAPNGITGTLTVSAEDGVGNVGSTENAGITYDSHAPVLSDLFPTVDDAPKDEDGVATITRDTQSPVFGSSEELDSLSVRYVEKGASPPHFVGQHFSSGAILSDADDKLVTATVRDTSFMDGVDYYLQIVAVDFAGNASVTDAQELRFTKDFENPAADSFVVATAVDDQEAVVAGAALALNLTALDTQLTRMEGEDVKAPTYRGDSRVRVVVSDDQASRLEGVSFDGDNVSIAPADTGMGIATLGSDGWQAGARSIEISSEMTLSDVMVVVEDRDADGDVTFSTELGPFSFDAAKFAAFTVQAMEDGEATDNVIGTFQISVTATDEFGNPSMKIGNTIDSDEEDEVHKTIAIEFSSNNSQVSVPSGRQEIVVGANMFDASASESSSGTVVISVYATAAAETGTDTLNFGPVAPPPAPGAPGAPASLIVQDYKGPSGDGDQGGMVMVSFPNSADHATVDKYQIYREVSVTTGPDSLGNLVELDEAMLAWVPWAALSQEDPNADVQRAVIPALDNVPTNWAVAAVGVGGSSGQTSATAKRVFSKESVQQTLELLGMAPEAVLTSDELMNQFNAPEDYVQSILGDQENLVFAPVNPDVSALLGNGSVPANIRTSSDGGGLASERTATEKPVGATDDIAPAAATDAAGALGSDGETALVNLSWTVSSDDGRIVDAIPYRGHSVPIYGVKGYRVLRGTVGDDAPEVIGTVGAGSSAFVDMNLPDGAFTLTYRIDALDDNNATPGEMITVYNIANRAKFVDAEGEPVFLMVLPPVGDLEVNFEDIIAFAAAFGSQKGDDNYNVQADVNDDGMVDFSDFVTASGSFGRTVAAPASKMAVVPQRPGVNADTEMRLELGSEKVLVGETISVTVSMANVEALNGYGLELMYDADKFEFVSAVAAEKDLLKSEGGETPLFKNWADEGRVTVVNAITGSGSVGGEGALVTFTFKVLREFEDSARFEIAQGVVFDPERLSNPVVTLGALDVQSTPTEFALHQNYPNPFNPQTNIPYDLAEGGDVVLRIYNLLGQEVRTLVRERQAPGRYTVQWSGMDDRGVSVSSGIYFYQVSIAGKFQDAKRLMLLK